MLNYAKLWPTNSQQANKMQAPEGCKVKTALEREENTTHGLRKIE